MRAHSLAAQVFWVSAALVVYTYLLYPLLLAWWARRRSQSPQQRPADPAFQGTFSIVMCAHNEAARLAERLAELQRRVGASCRTGEIIVVSDGSTDDTAAIAHEAGAGVRVLELSTNVGKARALTLGCAEARGDVLVMADVRQRWAAETLETLLDNFSRPEVGAVSGELMLESSPGTLSGVGLYWRYEKWIRHNEGIVNSTVGVSGSIAAVRRTLFKPIPQGIVLDDLYWPMQVVLGGSRVIHDAGAMAFDRLPPRPQDELRRKIRTLSGNFQLLAALPATLVPIRNPVWIQFISHKVLRLLVPWLLIALFITSAAMTGTLFRLAFWGQALLYSIAVTNLAGVPGFQSRLAATFSSFVLLNVAAWIGFWVWISGGTGRSWRKTEYQRPGQLK